MRTAVTLLGLGLSLASIALACGGEVAPDSTASSTSEQRGAAPAPATPSASTDAVDSGADANVAPAYCGVDAGAPVTGECTIGDIRTCPPDVAATANASTSGGTGGFCQQMCANVDGVAAWSEPTTNNECAFYDTSLVPQDCGCTTPLVLAFDNQRVVFTGDATGEFDLTHLGISHGSDWPSAATPWLALDRDGNGTIDDGGELFGSATRLASGGFAKNGFEALRDLDENHDGVFDERDPAFARIVVWSDRNGNKKSEPSELSSLAERGVTSLSLRDKREPHCDARGNCEGERASFGFGASVGSVVDVYLPIR